MAGLMAQIPLLACCAFIALGSVYDFALWPARIASLALAVVALAALAWLRPKGEASPISLATGGYLILAAVGFWLWPSGLGVVVAAAPVAVLYLVFLLQASLPQLLGKEPFTIYFAKKDTDPEVWDNPAFWRINLNMTWVWAGLFALCGISALMPVLIDGLRGLWADIVFSGAIPVALLVGFGVPFNKRYPPYYLRKRGLKPEPEDGDGVLAGETKTLAVKERIMPQGYKVVAVNGSPHAGIGNTSMMVDMLKIGLEAEGIEFENIFLTEKDINYCVGCGLCIEKGKCWRSDDHAGIVQKLLEADGIILASPVYFHHVTAQMKTFLDRSLAYGHKPRPAWKPGLAVSVSAGMGETQVGAYLEGILRCYGAFPVGAFTAIATSPGGFLGKELVEARAADLARDLARAIKEKRRYPASDNDLFFWLVIGQIVKSNKDFMKDDYAHWQELGILDNFENYIQQKFSPVVHDPEMRDAWLRQMIAAEKDKGAGKAAPAKPKEPKGPADFTSCLELIKAMPRVFNPAEAGDLAAAIQFEITGDEEFTAHLAMADGKCEFKDGPAGKPDLVIKSPADVWLGVSKGEIDGQGAFMGGKYKADGNLGLLMRMSKLFSN